MSPPPPPPPQARLLLDSAALIANWQDFARAVGGAACGAAIKAHGYGLSWFEQNADSSFTERKIMGATAAENPQGIVFSQLHAIQMADVNGDGLVNGIDLAFILTYWGSSAPIADLNDDGAVNAASAAAAASAARLEAEARRLRDERSLETPEAGEPVADAGAAE